MTAYDLYLISPPLALAALALLVIVVDLLTRRTGLLVGVSFVGLAAPAALSAWQMAELSTGGRSELTAESSVVLYTLSIDRFALFFNFLILAAAGLVILVSCDYVRRMQRLQGEFFALLLLSATGMMLLVAADELITMYIALELTTLPLAALAAFLPNGRSSEAGMKFLIIGAVSSALMLYGMALLYGFTGSTRLEEIALALTTPAGGAAAGLLPFGSMAVLLAVALLLVGFGFKMSAAPFQMWVPDVYEGAPTPMVAFLSVASKAAAFALVLRVFYIGFDALHGDWWVLLAGLAALSMTIGNLVAIAQQNIKRLFGYSTIAHAGYILVGVAAIATVGGDTFGPSSVLFYLAAYTAANLTALFAIVCIGNRINSDAIADYAGMLRRAPFLAIALALALIALIGVPPTSVFIAKIYIFAAAINTGESLMTWLVVIAVVNSVVSAYYYLRIIKVMFLQPAINNDRLGASWPVNVAVSVAALSMLWLGIAPATILAAAERAAAVLLGSG